MRTKQAILVDLDSTLADPKARLHYVRSTPRNFDAFEAEAGNDPVVKPVEKVVRWAHNAGIDVLIVSARMDNRRHITENWLRDHNIPHTALYMRKHKDSRKDDIIKKEILDSIKKEGYDILFAIDDRKRVLRMWAENGIFIFNVNQTDTEY